jgi:protein TonB
LIAQQFEQNLLASVTATAGKFDRLSSTLFVAVLAHGVVILGVTFAPFPTPELNEIPSLNVTLLVDSATADADVSEAELLASRNQKGAGEGESLRPTRTLTAEQPRNQLGEPLGADAIDAEALTPDTPADQLISQNPSDRQVEAVPETTDQPAPEPMRAAALFQQTAPATLAAELDLTAENARSDDGDIAAPSTREYALSAYMVGWRQRVERVGTANFPAEFLTGNANTGHPIVEVAIDAEGTIAEMVLRRSSGNTRLDQAAFHILELAAPFEPLPKEILAEADRLRFTYEWDFSR